MSEIKQRKEQSQIPCAKNVRRHVGDEQTNTQPRHDDGRD